MTSQTKSLVTGVQAEWHSGVAEIAEEWDELADRAGAAPFLRPGWIAPLLSAWADAPQIIALREGVELRAVLPLVRTRGVLSSAANAHSPLAGAVIDDPSYAHELARVLVRARAARTDLRALDSGDLLLPALRAAALEDGHTMIERITDREPYVELAGSFQDYEAGLARKHRKELARLHRRLGEEGTVTFEFGHGTDRLPELLEEGFAIEGSGWKNDRGTAIRAVPQAHRFYTEVAHWAAARGWLRLAFLRLDGRAIAFDYCLEAGGSLYALKGGYDVDFRRFSPGSLLTFASIQYAFERGLDSYEFLGTDDAYKLHWTSTVRERRRLQIFSRSVTGRGQDAAWRYGRPFVKQLKRRLGR